MLYAIRNDKTGRYIALDQDSGYYPYETDLELAHFWKDIRPLIEYIGHFPKEDWSIYECEVLLRCRVSNL